ncbi:threonine dehydrogenase-like Zn-dependent dehydrogenase [Stackebrandtia albiflava]|uniref:Threonine dehydrogenase-like Zn-dependent dehydrogenase n=1 Tax=Stackebrandtia albiflava TaxID=406432 RepID=A0A562VA37_9ACTN|nr:zinc-dependent alcohol dehydrogenase [Stackebrandtia albiflava]TWJ14713.1 threonine dehydrogenase-like Zn-dependent dehydrogenase [Stackebrandtia albiflava]
MKAVTWQGREDIRVTEVADPRLQEPTDAVIRVTSTAVCGSDLHLYSVLGMYLTPGDVLGHEAMGIVTEVGPEVVNLRPGDRVVIPFNISCGHCWMCDRGLMSQCETTQVRDQGTGGALFGYTSLYGAVPGGQAEYLRVPHAGFGPIKIPQEGPDEDYLFLSDVLPTAWQGVRYAGVEPGTNCLVVGLGPVGQMAARIARHLGADPVVAVDSVPERLAMARRHGVDVIDSGEVDDVAAAVRDRTHGRGADAVVEAVGMEAHGAPVQEFAQKAAGILPDRLAKSTMEKMGVDRMAALTLCFDAVRRGGTVSILGVYGGQADPFPMMTLFDKQVTIRMGQANVKRWIDDIMPVLTCPGDPLGVRDLTTHREPLTNAPEAYRMFQRKTDGCVKVVLKPGG